MMSPLGANHEMHQPRVQSMGSRTQCLWKRHTSKKGGKHSHTQRQALTIERRGVGLKLLQGWRSEGRGVGVAGEMSDWSNWKKIIQVGA